MLRLKPGYGRPLITQGRAFPPRRGCDLLRLRALRLHLCLAVAHAADALLNHPEFLAQRQRWQLEHALVYRRRFLLLPVLLVLPFLGVLFFV